MDYPRGILIFIKPALERAGPVIQLFFSPHSQGPRDLPGKSDGRGSVGGDEAFRRDGPPFDEAPGAPVVRGQFFQAGRGVAPMFDPVRAAPVGKEGAGVAKGPRRECPCRRRSFLWRPSSPVRFFRSSRRAASGGSGLAGGGDERVESGETRRLIRSSCPAGPRSGRGQRRRPRQARP